jgi:hypothetical protein
MSKKRSFVSTTVPMLVLVGMSVVCELGCDGGWVTEVPSANASTNPYEDVYRLLSTSKMYGGTPVRVDVSETVATLTRVNGDGVVTRAIPFAQVDVRLQHHDGRDKWAVDVYGTDGKKILRLESPDGAHAHELASVLEMLKVATSR